MLRRLWQILGPVFCAVVLVGLVIALTPVTPWEHSLTAEKNDAVALSRSSFRSGAKKVRALSDPTHRFVAFFGSSEWLRIDKTHPSVLAEGYQRNYTPYLIGQAGTSSLSHYFGMQQISAQLENKQAVFVVSPQWFSKAGYSSSAFRSFFSKGQLIDFLQNQKGTDYDQYAARRFLSRYPDVSLKNMVEKVSEGKKLSTEDYEQLEVQSMIYKKEDALFNQFSFSNDNENKLMLQAKELPQPFSYDALAKIATKDGKRSTTNNPFKIDNQFYNLNIKGAVDRLKGSQSKISYLTSQEYNDFQLILNQFASTHTNVLFVFQPINTKWLDYTGLDQEMYRQSVDKIKYQLQSQGFTNIADFSQDGNRPYYMQDTIHIGWKGWLALDQYIDPFLSHPKAAPTYHLNDQFLTKSWANYKGQPDQFGVSQ